ncbi:MAG: hypothetical protein AAB874_04080, partial [Patescibacteria group bacterium]
DTEKKILEVSLEEVSHSLEEGVALVDLNPIRARQLLDEAKQKIETELQKTSDAKTKRRLEDVLTKIETGIQLALHKYDVKLTPFFEFSLIKPGAKGDDVALYQDVVGVLDRATNAVYTISLATKSSRIVAGGGSLEGATQISIHGEDIYVLGAGISRVVVPGGELKTVVTGDEEWGQIQDMVAFAGNIYLLDPQKGKIWKYVRTDSGFSTGQSYLLADALSNLQNSQQIAVDGSVWIARRGEIVRFVGGEETAWKIKGLDENFGQNIRIYADDSTVNIYILDSDNKRVAVLNKDGTYLSQYHWNESMPISSLVVSEVLKKIILLSSDTMYAIELK